MNDCLKIVIETLYRELHLIVSMWEKGFNLTRFGTICMDVEPNPLSFPKP